MKVSPPVILNESPKFMRPSFKRRTSQEPRGKGLGLEAYGDVPKGSTCLLGSAL